MKRNHVFYELDHSLIITRDFQKSFILKLVDNLFFKFLYVLFVSRETVRPQTQLQRRTKLDHPLIQDGAGFKKIHLIKCSGLSLGQDSEV